MHQGRTPEGPAGAFWHFDAMTLAGFWLRCASPEPRCAWVGWSVPAKSSRRFGGLQLGQVELADCPQSIGGGAVLQVVRQCFQPDGVLRL